MSTLSGFKGGFYALNKRSPTEQEIFDEGVREGRARYAPTQGSGLASVAMYQEREAFEQKERSRLGFGADTLTRYGDDEEYLLPLVQARWLGWQDRAQGADARPVAISEILSVLDDLHTQDSLWCRGDALDLTKIWKLRKQLQSEKGVI
jgi:hypothetical protein